MNFEIIIIKFARHQIFLVFFFFLTMKKSSHRWYFTSTCSAFLISTWTFFLFDIKLLNMNLFHQRRTETNTFPEKAQKTSCVFFKSKTLRQMQYSNSTTRELQHMLSHCWKMWKVRYFINFFNSFYCISKPSNISFICYSFEFHRCEMLNFMHFYFHIPTTHVLWSLPVYTWCSYRKLVSRE